MLECKNITVKIGNNTIIKNISLVCNTGLTCILGQNGAGKSTIMRVLSGQIDTYNGLVSINGNDIKKNSILERSKLVVFMTQSYEVAFDFTVQEIINMGFHGFSLNQNILQQAIETTNVKKLLDRNYNTLSGGEKQRVQFARAIVRLYSSNAKLLFLDEPSSSADIKQELNMITIAKEIANQGYCVIMVSHNISLALKYTDSVILLKNGQLQKHAKEASKQDIMECFEVNDAAFF